MNDRLRDNIMRLKENIMRSADASGRDAAHIKLVVVTKTISHSVINELYELGICDIGENRIREARGKFSAIKHPYRWHMIGHLQTNKVNFALEMFSIVHSVDSLRLGQAISGQAEKIGKKVDIFIEVNTSGEESKYGFGADEVPDALSGMQTLAGISVMGFMTMAPLTDDKVVVQDTFSKLREIRDNFYPDGSLSMGMSQDYEIAIREGADILRIGSAIFEGIDNNSGSRVK